MVDCIRS